MNGPLVSVIVPAFNAEVTIGETVRSALAQTHDEIEIIVVDDGSSDATAARVAETADGDPRVILIRQARGGVGAARNAGIAAARGDYVAPLDADDLWHPDKLARQIAVAQAAAEPLGFVYTYFRRIDAESRVLASCEPLPVSGRVLHRQAYRNFVGNGSSLLLPRAAVIEAGGYDENIPRMEDYLLQLRIASRYPIGVVPAYLVGYRDRPGSLATCRESMFEAWLEVRRRAREDGLGLTRDPTGRTHAIRCLDLVVPRVRAGRLPAAIGLLARAARADPRVSLCQLHFIVEAGLKRRFRPPAPAPRRYFSEMPAEPSAGDKAHAVTGALKRLRRIDARRFAALAALDEA
jgi:glycosyltransferase involved in cell wall biosynthesis